jgi:hypothetical protein
VSYPEQSQAIREALARVLEGEEEWTKAAQVLQGIDLDSGGCRWLYVCVSDGVIATAGCAGQQLMDSWVLVLRL